jgi:hypothetical protein
LPEPREEGVEHLIVVLADFLVWLNRLSQRPVHKVVPQIRELLADPRGMLALGPVVIPPVVPRGSVLLWTLILTFFVWCGGFIALTEGLGPPPAREPSLVRGIVGLAGFLAVPVPFWLLFSRLLRGGTLELSLDGVRFLFRGVEVHCPWALFAGPGVHRERRHLSVVFVAREAVPEIKASRSGLVFAEGEDVTTRPLKVVSPNEIAIRSLYKVPLSECVGLLIDLSRRLQPSPSERRLPTWRPPLPPCP